MQIRTLCKHYWKLFKKEKKRVREGGERTCFYFLIIITQTSNFLVSRIDVMIKRREKKNPRENE